MAGAVPLPGLVATPLGQGCSSALRTHCRYCFALSFGVCVFPDSLFYDGGSDTSQPNVITLAQNSSIAERVAWSLR